MSIQRSTSNGQVEKPSIGNWSDSLRRLTPLEIQCQMFCGGKKCKYEGASHWGGEQMALNGIFSNWITCNILAMARPNTEQIMRYDLIGQFKKNGIRSIINLQQAGEHGSCGNGLESGGFSYNSSDFMENQIYFYNFPWKDYGVASLEAINDVMKVISFALVEGKLAVHCHAGLGRTGVVIACYLIYRCRITGNAAIRYVRVRRPNSIQTRLQVATVIQFEQYIWSSFIVICRRFIDDEESFTLDEYLRKQDKIHHGYEARLYKYLPKIIHQVCERLLELAGLQPVGKLDETTNRETFWKQFICMNDDDFTSTPMTPSSPMSSRSSLFPAFNSGLGTSSGPSTPLTVESPEYPSAETPKPPKKKTATRVKLKGKHLLKSLKQTLKPSTSGKKKEPPIDEEESRIKSTTPTSVQSSISGRSSVAGESEDSFTESDEETVAQTSQTSEPGRTTSGWVSRKKKNFTSTDSLPVALKVESDDEDEDYYKKWNRRKRNINKEPEEEEEEAEDCVDEEEGEVSIERMVSAQVSMMTSEDHLLSMKAEDITLSDDEIFIATAPTEPDPNAKTNITSPQTIADAMMDTVDSLPEEMLMRVDELSTLLNNSHRGWEALSTVDDPVFLVDLLYIWLDQLKQPVLSKQDLTTIMANDYLDEPSQCLHKLSKSTRITFEYLLRFVNRVQPNSDAQKVNIIHHLLIGLTQNRLDPMSESQTTDFIFALLNVIK